MSHWFVILSLNWGVQLQDLRPQRFWKVSIQWLQEEEWKRGEKEVSRQISQHLETAMARRRRDADALGSITDCRYSSQRHRVWTFRPSLPVWLVWLVHVSKAGSLSHTSFVLWLGPKLSHCPVQSPVLRLWEWQNTFCSADSLWNYVRRFLEIFISEAWKKTKNSRAKRWNWGSYRVWARSLSQPRNPSSRLFLKH